MLWDGNRQIQEQTDTHVFTTIYEQDSFEPVARLAWLHVDLLQSANDEIIKAERESWEPEPTLIPNIKVYHYHNDHLGTPNELTNQDGEVVWLADYEAWGNTAKVVWREEKLGKLKVSVEELQPIRFQGQSFDVETGLHYNRFRYYDPDLGMFTTRDPIGLMGGNNVFQYAPNPIGWIDPFGLSCSFSKKQKKDFEAYKQRRGGTRTLGYIKTPDGKRQRISIEFHHVFITQRMQRRFKLPNWLVNNRLNVWKLNTIQHAILDKHRFRFINKSLKPYIGLFKKYGFFSKF